MCTNPGFTVCTWIPRGLSSRAIEREKASCACFEAEYGPTATVPATETTFTRCDGSRGLERGQERLEAPDRAEVVDPDQLLDSLRRKVEVVAAPGHARVVHEQSDLGMALADRSGHPLDRVAVGNVADLVFASDLRGRRLESVLAPPDEHAQPVALGQLARDGGADAGPAAGDDRDAQGGPG